MSFALYLCLLVHSCTPYANYIRGINRFSALLSLRKSINLKILNIVAGEESYKNSFEKVKKKIIFSNSSKKCVFFQ